MSAAEPGPEPSIRHQLYTVIFEHDTQAGKAFDVALLWAVVFSVAVVVLESVNDIRSSFGSPLRALEWVFTVLFTVEYGLRLYSSPVRWRYSISFFGIVDLLAILPTYASVFVPGAQSLLVVRVLRLLRVFRVLKLVSFRGEADALVAAVRASMPKITVFLFTVLSLVVIVGASMYLIEGPRHGFSSIPRSMYWAIVTLTTVGFGDITPQTTAGQLLASILMVVGYGVIAVPTGIVSAEMTRASGRPGCVRCSASGHQPDARYCRRCGAELADGSVPSPGRQDHDRRPL